MCVRLVEEFIEKGAYTEMGRCLDTFLLDTLNLAAIGNFVSQGVLHQGRDESGGGTLSLNISALLVSGTGVCSGPSLICSRAVRGDPAHKLSKLELVQRLLHKGWECVEDAPRFFRQGERQVFSSAGLLQAKQYFQCLLSAQDIFVKPGAPQGIAHHGRRLYYEALLSGKDFRRSAISETMCYKCRTQTQKPWWLRAAPLPSRCAVRETKRCATTPAVWTSSMCALVAPKL